MLAKKKVKTDKQQKMEEEVKVENNRLMEEETKPEQIVQNETIIITTITSGSDNSNVQVSTTMTQDQTIINTDVANPEIK